MQKYLLRYAAGPIEKYSLYEDVPLCQRERIFRVELTSHVLTKPRASVHHAIRIDATKNCMSCALAFDCSSDYTRGDG